MKQFRKRFLAALLSFVMVFLSMSDMFTAHAALPAVVDDPDVVADVTYDQVAVASRGNSRCLFQVVFAEEGIWKLYKYFQYFNMDKQTGNKLPKY